MTVETSAPGFLRSLLRDSRLSTLATSRFPAWLWSQDGRRLLWANPVGAAMFGAPSSAAVIGRNFDADEPAAAAIARIAPTLVKGASPRLERLHGLGAGIGRALTCACSLVALSGHSSAILVAAAEPAGPDLPFAERIRRLLAGTEGPIAGFTGDGRVLHALDTASSRGQPLRFIWQIDDQGRFTLGSDEFIALTGPHTAAAIGRTWSELEAELNLDPEGKVAGAIATRDTWSGLMVSWPVDDSPMRLAVELSGLPVFDRDRTFRGYRGFGVCRDIAQWKKKQDELGEARHHLELASAVKSDLLAKISHEVRTPLYSIIGFSEVMMEEQYGPIGNERLREYLKDIHASGDQLMSLVNDLLDLAKIEAGELVLAFSDVALDDLTRQCVTMMRTQASHRHVIIRTSLWPSPPRVVADAQLLRKIVLGLLSNAIKFTDAGGQVIVSTAHTENGEVVMHVRNPGVGMRGGDIVTAFESLRQLGISARRDAVSGDLSLRLTKALTEANHASFKLTGASKEGTLVEIAFPASRVLAG